jgi:hypothetical protein
MEIMRKFQNVHLKRRWKNVCLFSAHRAPQFRARPEDGFYSRNELTLDVRPASAKPKQREHHLRSLNNVETATLKG